MNLKWLTSGAVHVSKSCCGKKDSACTVNGGTLALTLPETFTLLYSEGAALWRPLVFAPVRQFLPFSFLKLLLLLFLV